MAAYRPVYDSRHLHADCQEPELAPEPTLGNVVRPTFFTMIFKTTLNAEMISVAERQFAVASL